MSVTIKVLVAADVDAQAFAEQLRADPRVLGANVYTAAGMLVLPDPLPASQPGKDGE